MNTYFVLFVVVSLSAVTVLGDYLIKLSGSTSNKYIDWKLFVIGLCTYLITSIGWFFIMKHMKLSTIGVVYGIATALFLVTIGVLKFKETLNVYEITGICLGVIALILLSRFAG